MARKKKITPKALSKMDIDQLAALPGMMDLYMYDPRGHLFDSPEDMPHKRLVTGNAESGEKWIDYCLSLGLMYWDDVLEERERLMGIIGAAKRANGQGAYDPASVANKKSGRGEKPSRKPTRDYRMPTSVRNNGNPTGVVRMGRDYGPAS